MTTTRKIVKWFGLAVLLALLFSITGISRGADAAPKVKTDKTITHFSSDDAHNVSHVSPFAKKPHPHAGGGSFSSAYGWAWDHVALVCDATGVSPDVWDVAGAVEAWARAGVPTALTGDCGAADIVVEQGDANAFCGTPYSTVIIGCGGSDIGADGKPYQGKVVMNASWADWVYWQPRHGGTRHELGHTYGYGHPAGLTNDDSIMGVPIPSGSTAQTVLTPYDKSGVRYLY